MNAFPDCPPTSIDYTDPVFRSYVYKPTIAAWELAAEAFHDFMIRAVVQSPTGKNYLNYKEVNIEAKINGKANFFNSENSANTGGLFQLGNGEFVVKSGIKSLQTFGLFLLNEVDINNPENWIEVDNAIPNNVFTYTDTQNWPPSETGNFLFAVVANYESGTSETAFSNILSFTVSIKNIDSENINIYPNPSKGEFYINVEENYNLQILDLTGGLIKTQVLDKKNNTVVINKPGVYLLRLTSNNASFSQRLIITK